MKKALSLILALVMIFALATVAFADTKHVVGNRGGDGAYGDYRDGVEPGAFTVTPPTVDVPITVSAVTTNNRYAVDVEWNTTAISLGGGEITWDVNTMTYVTSGVTGGTEAKTWNITIKNYSDLPVLAWATINDLKPADFMDVSANHTEGSKLTVAKATAGTGGNPGTLTDEVITITLKPADEKTWADVVEYYTINHPGEPSVTAATATVSISKVS